MSFLRFVIENRTWLAAGVLISFISSFGQTFYIAIYAADIRAAHGLSHGEWGGLYTLGTASAALLMVWAGMLTDRLRARALGVMTMAVLACACLAMAALPDGWILGLAVVVFVLRFAGQGMLSHVSMVAMARWFVATRGRALAIATLGFAFGQAILPVSFVALSGWLGWRGSWVVAAGCLVVAMPLTWALLGRERTPQSIAAETSVHGMAGRHWSRMDALRHPLFWLVLPAMVGPPAWGTALFFQQVHLTEIKGWTMAQFVGLMPLFTAVTVVSTLTAGWAIDRIGTPRLTIGFMLPYAVGFAILGLAPTIPGAALALVFVGIGNGLHGTVPSAFWAEHYGTQHLGAIKSAAVGMMVLGSALGPGITGVLIDAGIGFEVQLMAMAGYFVVAGVLGGLGIRLVARRSARAAQVDV